MLSRTPVRPLLRGYTRLLERCTDRPWKWAAVAAGVVAASRLGGPYALLALGAPLGACGLLLGLCLAGAALGPAREQWLRRALGCCFLGPRCLRFGPCRCACRSCGEELGPFYLHGERAASEGCPFCGKGLVREDEPDPAQ